jgi:hypothetical protein
LENLKRGLVLWVKLDEGSGTTTADSSGYGNTGTLYDANTTNTDGNTPPKWVDGKYGKALSFDGVDDYVDIPNNPNGNYSRALVAWVKNVPNSGRYDVINSRGTFFNIQNGKVCIYILGASSSYLCSSSLLNFNQWNFMAGVYDYTINTVKVYVNGLFSGSLVLPNYPDTASRNDVIGWCSYCCPLCAMFNGTIDEVRIYNRALSAEEIQALYYEGATNKFNVTFLLLNKGSANLGFNFSAALFLQNKTVINKRFDLNSSFRAAATEEVNLNFDDYYPGYADIEKLKVCSIACPGVCAEIKETMC